MAFPPRPIVVHLLHATYCATVGVCACSTIVSSAARWDPVKRVRVHDRLQRRFPLTVTVWPRGQVGDVSGPLDASVLELEEISSAIARHELVVLQVPVPSAPAADAEPAAEVVETAPEGTPSAPSTKEPE